MNEDMREASCAAVHHEETDLQRIHRREKKGTSRSKEIPNQNSETHKNHQAAALAP